MSINGSKILMNTLIENGVEVCFGNPGTSEMHLVDAISKADNIKAVLGLFEGVVTGAADGYARMAEKPAATLLHLGPGLANGLANIHNAKRARTPMVNLIGQHALDHLQYEAPLKSDIEGLARPLCHHIQTTTDVNCISQDAAKSIAAANSNAGQIASLIIPADMAWSVPTNDTVEKSPAPNQPKASGNVISNVAAALGNGKKTALLLDNKALYGEALRNAGRIAKATGAQLICPTFFSRTERGAGTVPVGRIPYFAEMATEFLKDIEQLILVGGTAPVSFFAYPGKPSWLLSDGTDVVTLSSEIEDSPAALQALAQALECSDGDYEQQAANQLEIPTGELTPEGVAACLNAYIPENAIVMDEGATSALPAYPMTQAAAKHDWLTLTGGSIGQGLPAAMGAAVACPDRKIICLEGDGSAMYTVQALWSIANQNQDMCVVMYVNHSYRILNVEMQRVGVEDPSPAAAEMLELENPKLDWKKLAEGMGVPTTVAKTTEEFEQQFKEAMQTKGPRLIAAMVSKAF